MRNQKTYYVETYRPAFPSRGVHFRVHESKGFENNWLSASMTSVFRVEGVTNKQEAVAVAIEKLAGKNVRVSQVY